MAKPLAAASRKALAALKKERKKTLLALKKMTVVDPRRPPLKTHLANLNMQISALMAAKSVGKGRGHVQKDLDKEEERNEKIKAQHKKASGKNKVKVAKRLGAAKRRLAEKRAAAAASGVSRSEKSKERQAKRQAKRGDFKKPWRGYDVTITREPDTRPPPPPGYSGYSGEEALALAEEADLVTDPEWTEDQALAIEEGFFDPEFDGTFSLDTLGEYTDDLRYGTGEWYKNPIVLAGAGVALYLVLKRR
jgi:hypothetical protein